MPGIKITFWINNLPSTVEGEIQPAHAWEVGYVAIVANRPRGIRSGAGEPFHRFAEIGPAIEETLRKR